MAAAEPAGRSAGSSGLPFLPLLLCASVLSLVTVQAGKENSGYSQVGTSQLKGIAELNKRISLQSYNSRDVQIVDSWPPEGLNASSSASPASSAAAKFGSNGISNPTRGPVMSKPVGVYLIWVGSFTHKQKGLVKNFIASLNPSKDKSNTVDDWWAINTRYYGGKLVGGKPTGGTVSKKVNVKGEHMGTAASFGFRDKVVTDVFKVVTHAIRSQKWSADPNAVYAVFTDKTIVQKGAPGSPNAASCVDYCGWHSFGTFRGQQLKYSFQGLPQCSGCGSDLFASNGGPYSSISIDSRIHQAISTFAHELAEATSDPYLNSWYDGKGYENADKCQYSYGKIYGQRLSSNRVGIFNVAGKNGQKFLVQQNWDPVSGQCVVGV